VGSLRERYWEAVTSGTLAQAFATSCCGWLVSWFLYRQIPFPLAVVAVVLTTHGLVGQPWTPLSSPVLLAW
jgi:hypothetical protein